MTVNRIGGNTGFDVDQLKADQVKDQATTTPVKTESEPAPAISMSTNAPVKQLSKRQTMNGMRLRDKVESQLQSKPSAEKTTLDTSARTTWGSMTPSARSTKTSATRATSSTAAAGQIDALTNKAALAAPVKRSVTFTFDAGDHSNMTNLQMKGSWNKSTGQFDSQWGNGDTVAMKPLGNGKWSATVELLDDGQPHKWEWGVVADTPNGKAQWAVMTEGNLKFDLNDKTKQVNYAPTTYHEMGAHKVGEKDISFKFWAPDAQHVSVKVTDQLGKTKLIPMKRDSEGNWTASVKNGWKSMEGKSYVYQLVDSGGKTVERPDPYARVMQGEQRGIGRTYVDLKTGEQRNQFYTDPEVYKKYKDQIEGPDPALAETARQKARDESRGELVRFEVDDEFQADNAYLVFKDDNGRQLSRMELVNKLGRFDSSLIDKLNNGKFNDLWSNNIDDAGRIQMTNEAGTFVTLVNNLDKLTGLHYEMQVFKNDAQGKPVLLKDTNKDGKLSETERKASGFNDKWSDVITPESGKSFRGSVISDSKYDWRSDNAARELDHNKWVIYQFHPGSFFGQAGNANRSTFEDVIKKLDYFKSLGVNTLEMLPANEVEGSRDWGYMGANSLAIESSYGFEDETGKWLSGAEALKQLVDMAHAKGFNVINDVVYNHVGGDYNALWNIDGKENPYFNWSTDPTKFEKRDTPWGAMPAYNNPKVKQFFVDHAVAQLEEFHFDGLRFDFTEPMKAAWGGGDAGRNMMREMNRQIHFYKPNAYVASEQFDYDPDITRPAKADGTGVGFDATWYTEFQHRLVHDNDNPSIIQQAAHGQRTDMDKFMSVLTDHRGLDDWSKAVTIISDHDEVGNAERTVDAANGDKSPSGTIPPQWTRNAARFAAGIGLASPGVPMFFQGDESMAQNNFKWGVPSTWDSGWDWQSVGKNWDWNNLTFNDNQRTVYNRLFEMPPMERDKDSNYRNLSVADRQVFNDLAAMSPADRDTTMLNMTRRQTYQFYKEALALRASSPAFEADASLQRVYTHNDNSVMAFSRKDGNDEYIVIGSLNKNNLEHYGLDLPPGQWKEVFNSDAGRFGGNNFGNFGAAINGGATQVNIPAGGYIVLKKS